MKKRLITAGITIIPSFYISLIGAYNVHMLLLKTHKTTLNPFTALTVFQIPKARSIFLLLFAAFLLAIAWMVFNRSYIKYKSDMYEVTPDIRIPKPEGQGQYGTSWFLDPKKIAQAFAVAEVDADSELIQRLVEHGYDDLREIETE